MIISVAGRFAERDWIKAYCRLNLEPHGIRVLARWLESEGEDRDLSDLERMRWSIRCFQDIAHSQALLYFPAWIPGLGRHREIGYALGIGKPVVLLGERSEHPHDWYPGITACREEDLIATLRQVALDYGR